MKVSQVRMHTTYNFPEKMKEVSVAEGKYVEITNGEYFKHLVISETEKIEKGDWGYGMDGLFEYKGLVNTDNGRLPNKVLVLPEQFSPQFIADRPIKDGDKVLVECEEKCSVKRGQCDCSEQGLDCQCSHNQINFNSQGHVTLHKVEEKMYTRDQVLQILALKEFGSEHISLTEAKQDYPKVFKGKLEKVTEWFAVQEKWFEQNVK